MSRLERGALLSRRLLLLPQTTQCSLHRAAVNDFTFMLVGLVKLLQIARNAFLQLRLTTCQSFIAYGTVTTRDSLKFGAINSHQLTGYQPRMPTELNEFTTYVLDAPSFVFAEIGNGLVIWR